MQHRPHLPTQAQTDRTNIEAEVSTLEGEIDRIANSTKYAGNSLIDGSFGSLSISNAGSLTGSNGVTAIDVSNASASTTYGITLSTGTGGGAMLQLHSGSTYTNFNCKCRNWGID